MIYLGKIESTVAVLRLLHYRFMKPHRYPLSQKVRSFGVSRGLLRKRIILGDLTIILTLLFNLLIFLLLLSTCDQGSVD